ncbi:ATP-binding protein [Nocardia sp. NPDC050710]|uniref:ATP-binding protein n=1 Tax=Nocardia sp. NPDC050710 TaxID=3157220 RepID=UPI0034009278
MTASRPSAVIGDIPARAAHYIDHGGEDWHRFVGPRGCALVGPPGSGKSQIAADYARRWAQQRGDVAWIDATTRDGILAGLVRMAGYLDVVVVDPVTTAGRVRDTLHTSERPTLLVFDDATNAEIIDPFLPYEGGGVSVLYTTTRRHFVQQSGIADHAVPVHGFNDEDSLRY